LIKRKLFLYLALGTSKKPPDYKMEIKEAFKILSLNIDSNKEEIETKFKELSKLHHPDKGGNADSMSELNNARELAIHYASNKSLIKIAQELVRTDNQVVMRSSEIDKEVSSIYKRAKRRAGNRLKSMKDIVGMLGLLSGVGTLIVSKVIPIMEIPKTSLTPKFLLLFTVVLSIYYLFFNNRIKKMEENVEDFTDSLNEKEYFYELLSEIINGNNQEKTNKTGLMDIIEEWSSHRLSRRSESSPFLLLSSSTSPKRICRLIGLNDFSKMILLKGEQHKFIEKEENVNKGKLEVEYKILKMPVPNTV